MNRLARLVVLQHQHASPFRECRIVLGDDRTGEPLDNVVNRNQVRRELFSAWARTGDRRQKTGGVPVSDGDLCEKASGLSEKSSEVAVHPPPSMNPFDRVLLQQKETRTWR